VSGVKYHRTAIGFEDGGFEIRDQIFWIDADHTTPVVFARRPLEEATIKENVMRYGPAHSTLMVVGLGLRVG
jgi:hypothetical protein